MITITRKVTLLPAPFVGIRIDLEVGEGLVYGIRTLALADGSADVTIDWGDGTVETLAKVTAKKHTYPAPGAYTVTVSDDVKAFTISTSDTSPEFPQRYAPLVKRVTIRSDKAEVIGAFCFNGCVNMESLDLRGAHILRFLGGAARNCTSLRGRVDLPHVTEISGTGNAAPFANCAALAELHFGAANRAVIEASAPYGDTPPFGAANAVIKFDL